MAKKRQEQQAQQAETVQPVKKVKKARAQGEVPWHPVVRWFLSLLILLHLLAVFSAPWDLMTMDALPPGFVTPTDAMGHRQPLPPNDSPVWQRPVVTRGLHGFFHHYLNLLYLNHGYEFFAPDPAGTHVIDYQVTKADGGVAKGRFPSLDEQWPRLFYHRHMMLAEQTELMGPQSGQHYADHLATVYGGPSQMQWKVHLLLPPHRVAEGTPLDAPSTYQLLGTVSGRPRPSAQTVETPRAESPIPIPGGQP